MSKPLFKLKCKHCHKRLADFVREKETGDALVVTLGDFELDLSKAETGGKGIAIAICGRCGGATEMDTKYLPGPESSRQFH